MVDILIIIVTLVGLGVGGHFFVGGAAAIGKKCGLTPVVIGATIVAMGTSLPEWAISVLAAYNGMTELSVGNVIGSNVCNLCIILGVAALVTPLDVHRSALFRDATIMLIATALMILFASDGQLGGVEGIVLLLGAVITLVVIFRFGKEEVEPVEKFHWWQIPMAIGSLALILVSSHYFVDAAESIANEMGVAPWIIGITVAAIGTSLPELVTSLAAAWQRHTGMIIGNVIGSNIMNIFLVLGSAASIKTLDTSEFRLDQTNSFGELITHQAVTFCMLMVLAVFLLMTSKRLHRWEGGILLAAGLGWYAFMMIPV